jgi:hypothetical protein
MAHVNKKAQPLVIQVALSFAVQHSISRGGPYRTRTYDLLIKSQLLYQLS